MKEPVWVLPAVVHAVHRQLLSEHGGLTGLRDEALLESALARPAHRFVYEDDLSLFDLAAGYGYGLIRNHPFNDGNKRIALATTAIFLEINACPLTAPEAETALVFESLAAGQMTERELAHWLEQHAGFPD